MRKEKLVPGHYYHIYNRGVDKSPIFFNRGNWIFFLRRLRHYATPEHATVIAYCLMPNHYHILCEVKVEAFGKVVMQPFTVSYTKAINKQQERVGSLFQGPFQVRRVDGDGYLMHLTRYIHLNPVTAGLAPRPDAWEFSSYRDYVGLRDGSLPQIDVVLSQFESQAAYADYVCGSDDPRAHLMERLLIDG